MPQYGYGCSRRPRGVSRSSAAPRTPVTRPGRPPLAQLGRTRTTVARNASGVACSTFNRGSPTSSTRSTASARTAASRRILEHRAERGAVAAEHDRVEPPRLGRLAQHAHGDVGRRGQRDARLARRGGARSGPSSSRPRGGGRAPGGCRPWSPRAASPRTRPPRGRPAARAARRRCARARRAPAADRERRERRLALDDRAVGRDVRDDRAPRASPPPRRAPPPSAPASGRAARAGARSARRPSPRQSPRRRRARGSAAPQRALAEHGGRPARHRQ